MNILYLVFLFLFFKCLGDILSPCLKIKENEHLLHLALGLITASYLTLFFASYGWLDRNLVLVVMAGVIVIRIKKISELLNLMGRKAIRFIKNLSAYEKVLFIILILQAGINFFLTLTPPTGWDSLAYHLTIPKLILREGRMIDYTNYGGTRYPLLVEMTFTLALLINDAGLVKLLCWSISILAVITTYVLAAKIGLKSVAFIASLVFYSTQVVSMWAGKCYIDITFAFFVTSATIILIEFQQKKGRSLLLVWLFIAILSGIKLNGLILSLIMGVYFTWQILIKGKNIKGLLKAMSMGVLITLVVNSPWYFMAKERRFSPDKAILYTSVLEKPSMVRTYLTYWLFTLGRLTLNCDRDGRIGPVFLCFLPLLILVRPLKKEIRLLLMISLSYVAIFLFFGYLIPRYVVPIMPLLGIVAAYVVMKLEARDKVLRYFLMGCLIFTFIFNVGLTLYNHRLELSYLIGHISKNDFLNTEVECYSAISYINQNIHQGTILLIGETRGYYLERPFRLAYVGDKSEKLEKLIKRYNITHILLNERVICNKKADISIKEFLEYFASHLELIYTKGFFKIYRVYNK